MTEIGKRGINKDGVMKLKVVIGIILFLVVLAGVGAGLILVRKRQMIPSQAAPTKAEEVQSLSLPTPRPGVFSQADFNQNGVVDEEDLSLFKQRYAAQDRRLDLDGSGEVNSLDYNLFLSKMK